MTNLDQKLKAVSMDPSPSVRTRRTTTFIMGQVILALMLPTAAAIYYFGYQAVILILISILTAVLSEYLYERIMQKKPSIHDLSAVVTGLLIGLSLPVTAPIWSVVLGSTFAIVVVKHIGGGLGKNMFNPAVASRVMLKIFFTPWITNWVVPGPDALSTATPLEFLGDGSKLVTSDVPSLLDLFLGTGLGGNMGETSKLMILIAMVYLIVMRIIHPKIPFLFVLGTTLTVGLYSSFNLEFMLSHALSGTLLFAAVFMATDYSSGALTPGGKTVFALGGGILTAVFRIAFNWPGGVGVAILIMNALAPFIDQRLMPRIYGHKTRPTVRFNRQGRG